MQPSPTGPSAEQEVAALWESVHLERLEQTYAEEEPDPEGFAGLATGDATEALLDLIRVARGDIPLDLVDSEFWPDIEISAGSAEASISDCVLVETRPASDSEAESRARSRVWSGTAVLDADGWVLDSVQLGDEGCVAPGLNQQLLAAYVAYHEAWTTAWDPPDPDHPLLAETMTGQRLAGIKELLASDRADGIAFRDPHDPTEHAVVFELGIGRATVSDCHEAHPEYGAYDVETGERRDDIVPPVEPGQLNLTSVELIRTEDGTWKVIEAGGLDKANCEPGGTDYVVAP